MSSFNNEHIDLHINKENKDLIEHAERFYSKFGFIALKDSKRMFLPLKKIIELFK